MAVTLAVIFLHVFLFSSANTCFRSSHIHLCTSECRCERACVSMHDPVSASLVFHSSLEHKIVYSNLICPEWETYSLKRLLTHDPAGLSVPFKRTIHPPLQEVDVHMCVDLRVCLECRRSRSDETAWWHWLIRTPGCVTPPGGLICMDMCGNQKAQRSIKCTLEQHEADRCGMPVGKSVLLGNLRMTYSAAFLVQADVSWELVSNLHYFVFF